MNTITVTREVTLTRIETLVIEAPDTVDLTDQDFAPWDHVVLAESHEVIDVVDASAWAVAP